MAVTKAQDHVLQALSDGEPHKAYGIGTLATFEALLAKGLVTKRGSKGLGNPYQSIRWTITEAGLTEFRTIRATK